jgi:hypothetical protein
VAVTDEQVSEALHMYGEEMSGMWGLLLPGGRERNWYPEATARAVIKACLILNLPMTGSGTITGEAWLALAERIEAIEGRLTEGGL